VSDKGEVVKEIWKGIVEKRKVGKGKWERKSGKGKVLYSNSGRERVVE
jgi:hypothetical protein